MGGMRHVGVGSVQNIRVTLDEVVGKIRELRKEARYCAFQQATALLLLSLSGYSPDVAAHSATGLGNPVEYGVTAPPTRLQRFFLICNSVYGGCAWDVFGRAGFLDSPVYQPAYSCHPFAWYRMRQLLKSRELNNAHLKSARNPASPSRFRFT